MHLKKATAEYTSLQLLVVIICLSILFVQLQTKFEKTKSMGEHQFNILAVNDKIDFLNFYLKDSARYSFESALLDVIGAKQHFPLYKEEVSLDQCTRPDLPEYFEPKLTERFNHYFNNFLEQLGGDDGAQVPENNQFLLGQDGNKIIITSLKSFNLSFADNYGEANYRPIVSIERGEKLENYIQMNEKIKEIIKECNNVLDPKGCSFQKISNLPDWKILKLSELEKQELPTLPWELPKEKKAPDLSGQNTYLILITIQKSGWGDQKICFKIELETKEKPQEQPQI